jgi:hypothetical protein
VRFKARYATEGEDYDGGIIEVVHDGSSVAINKLTADDAQPSGVQPNRQWSSVGLSLVPGAGNLWQGLEASVTVSDLTADGTAGDTELNAQFGNFDTDDCTLFLQNYVVSAPGRFVRAGFQGFADTEEPILRLYMSAPAISGDGTTARFKIKYTQATDPYIVPGNEESVTLTIVAPNTLHEIPVSFVCQANKPVRFTIERDWTHGSDTFEGTVFFHYATLRGV